MLLKCVSYPISKPLHPKQMLLSSEPYGKVIENDLELQLIIIASTDGYRLWLL